MRKLLTGSCFVCSSLCKQVNLFSSSHLRCTFSIPRLNAALILFPSFSATHPHAIISVSLPLCTLTLPVDSALHQTPVHKCLTCSHELIFKSLLLLPILLHLLDTFITALFSPSSILKVSLTVLFTDYWQLHCSTAFAMSFTVPLLSLSALSTLLPILFR
jgi:hypothetical protein